MNFGGVEENVVTREEFPLSKALEVLMGETIAVIGYGVQGPGQSLNLKDNGFNVIVGQRKKFENLGQSYRRRLGSRGNAFRNRRGLASGLPSFNTCCRTPPRSPYGLLSKAPDRRESALFFTRLRRYLPPNAPASSRRKISMSS